MKLSFDPAKNDWNIRERGISFELAAEMEFERAPFMVDERRDYGETRHVAIGRIHGRVHVLVFVETDDGIRVISLRKASRREVRRYETRSGATN